MKTYFKFLPLVLISMSLSSCLNEEDPLTDRNTEDSANTIQFAGTPTGYAEEKKIYSTMASAFPVVAADVMNVEILYAGGDAAPEDIEVTVAVNDQLIDTYNQTLIAKVRAEAAASASDPALAEQLADEAEERVIDHHELFDKVPTNLYTLTTNKVTIKKGESSAILPINVIPNKFEFTKRYGLPLTISQVSSGNISSNFGTVIYNISAKNQYHGEYTNTYSRTRISNGTTVVAGKNTAELNTSGLNSVDGLLIGYYGNTQRLTIDPATNKVTVTSAGIAITNDKSFYDPATKTFYVEYTALNTIMKSTMVRK